MSAKVKNLRDMKISKTTF